MGLIHGAMLSQSVPRITTRSRPGRQQALKEAIAIRTLTSKAAQDLGDLVKIGKNSDERTRAATAIASLTKAWESAYHVIRIIRGEPLPGSLRPEHKPTRKARSKPIEVQESPAVIAPTPPVADVRPAIIEEKSMLEDSPDLQGPKP